jgi:hypothetical protein
VRDGGRDRRRTVVGARRLDDLGARADRAQVRLIRGRHLEVNAAPLNLLHKLARRQAVNLDGVHQALLADGLLRRLRRSRPREEDGRAGRGERDE